MIAITTRSSISVNADRARLRLPMAEILIQRHERIAKKNSFAENAVQGKSTPE
jgi:hypothetical protein